MKKSSLVLNDSEYFMELFILLNKSKINTDKIKIYSIHVWINAEAKPHVIRLMLYLFYFPIYVYMYLLCIQHNVENMNGQILRKYVLALESCMQSKF